MPVHSDNWPRQLTDTPARRFTPVDEADLQREFDSAYEDVPGHRWPSDWPGFRQERARRDMHTIRLTRESTR